MRDIINDQDRNYARALGHAQGAFACLNMDASFAVEEIINLENDKEFMETFGDMSSIKLLFMYVRRIQGYLAITTNNVESLAETGKLSV